MDFSKARIRDVKWWRRFNMVVEQMSRDGDVLIAKTAYDYHLALVANSDLKDESWKKSMKNALDLFNNIINMVHPWGAQDEEARRNADMRALKEEFKQLVGDPDDPEFKRRTAEDLRAYYARLAEPPPESEEARIARRFRELKKT